jgi:Cu(I)/Ag(I) efflux system membrane protein CusA/SilA
MLGGLLSSAFLTLEVLPVLYTIWRARQLARAQRPATELVVSPPGVAGEPRRPELPDAISLRT